MGAAGLKKQAEPHASCLMSSPGILSPPQCLAVACPNPPKRPLHVWNPARRALPCGERVAGLWQALRPLKQLSRIEVHHWRRTHPARGSAELAAAAAAGLPLSAAFRSPHSPPPLPLQLDLKKLLPRKKSSSDSEGGSGGSGKMSDLPWTERELIQQCQREYETAAAHGGQEALDACFRWGGVFKLRNSCTAVYCSPFTA